MSMFRKKIDNEANLASSTSWQSTSGAAPKRHLKFSKNIAQSTSLTQVAFLGPWNG